MFLFFILFNIIRAYRTTLRSVPIPSTEHSTTSPDLRNLGGSNPMPTPEGVPVAMMVPGISVMPEESSSIISSMDVISKSVTESCRSSPLIRELICKAGGNAISSADVYEWSAVIWLIHHLKQYIQRYSLRHPRLLHVLPFSR